MRWRRPRTCPGAACAWAASTATPRSSSVSAAAALDSGLGDRVRFAGPRTGADLERSYAAADVLVLASRAETYGMVVTEALARGLPVVAAEVGGLTEALGHGADGMRPGAARPARRPCGTRQPRSGPGSATPSCGIGCAAPPASGARRSPAWSTTTSVRRRRPGRSVAMTAEAIRVSRGWLALREPADAAARAPDLVEAPRGDTFRRPVAR